MEYGAVLIEQNISLGVLVEPQAEPQCRNRLMGRPCPCSTFTAILYNSSYHIQSGLWNASCPEDSGHFFLSGMPPSEVQFAQLLEPGCFVAVAQDS